MRDILEWLDKHMIIVGVMLTIIVILILIIIFNPDIKKMKIADWFEIEKEPNREIKQKTTPTNTPSTSTLTPTAKQYFILDQSKLDSGEIIN